MMALKSQCYDTDRISGLPDALLCHILSYVTTKQSVQTSVLSKRWLHVWTGLPNIDIDDSILSLDPTLARDQSVYTSFTNFRTKVFTRGKEASPRKFTLTCSKFDVFHVNEWIMAAVKQRVRELGLSITIEVPFTMSCGLFAYKELVTLELGMKVVLKVPNGTFCFPSLKKLRLDYVVFDDDSIHNFLSRCPVLEELHVEDCSSKMWDTVVFSAPALKVFEINTIASTEDDYGCDYKLIVDAPSLESLDYTGYLATKGYCFKNLNSLVHASLDVCVDEEMDHIHRVLELFRGVANAEIITLTGYTLEVIDLYMTLEEHNVNNFPFFNSMRELVVGGNMYCGKMLPQLLHFSPNLKVLIVEDDLTMTGDLNDFYWDNIVDVPECLSRHLLLVEIWGYTGQTHVAKFIRYILSNGGAKTNVYASRVRSELMKVELIDQEFAYFDEWGVRTYKG